MVGCVKIDHARVPSSRAICRNGFVQIKLALHAYEKEHGRLPPPFLRDKSGKPAHSWRVLLLPYLESSALYDRYDFSKPWNDSHNLKIAQQGSRIFNQCPTSHLPAGHTSIVALVGTDTAWQTGDRNSVSENSILVVESVLHQTHWMAPNDFDIGSLPNDEEVRLTGVHGVAGARCVNVVFANMELGEVYPARAGKGVKYREREKVSGKTKRTK